MNNFQDNLLITRRAKSNIQPRDCPLGEMVDTTDLKSVGRKAVLVRVRQRAPLKMKIF